MVLGLIDTQTSLILVLNNNSIISVIWSKKVESTPMCTKFQKIVSQNHGPQMGVNSICTDLLTYWWREIGINVLTYFLVSVWSAYFHS